MRPFLDHFSVIIATFLPKKIIEARLVAPTRLYFRTIGWEEAGDAGERREKTLLFFSLSRPLLARVACSLPPPFGKQILNTPNLVLSFRHKRSTNGLGRPVKTAVDDFSDPLDTKYSISPLPRFTFFSHFFPLSSFLKKTYRRKTKKKNSFYLLPPLPLLISSPS